MDLLYSLIHYHKAHVVALSAEDFIIIQKISQR